MQTGHAGFDRFFSGPGAFVTGGTILPAWSPDGSALAFLEGTAEQRTGRLVDLATGDQRPLIADVGALREAVREATGQTPPGRGLPFEHLAFVGPRTVAAVVGAATVLIDVDSGEVTKAPAENPGDVYQGFADSVPYPAGVPAQPGAERPGEVARTPVTGWQPVSSPPRAGTSCFVRPWTNGRVRLTTDGTPEHEYRFDLVELGGGALPFTAVEDNLTRWLADR